MSEFRGNLAKSLNSKYVPAEQYQELERRLTVLEGLFDKLNTNGGINEESMKKIRSVVASSVAKTDMSPIESKLATLTAAVSSIMEKVYEPEEEREEPEAVDLVPLQNAVSTLQSQINEINNKLSNIRRVSEWDIVRNEYGRPVSIKAKSGG